MAYNGLRPSPTIWRLMAHRMPNDASWRLEKCGGRDQPGINGMCNCPDVSASNVATAQVRQLLVVCFDSMQLDKLPGIG